MITIPSAGSRFSVSVGSDPAGSSTGMVAAVTLGTCGASGWRPVLLVCQPGAAAKPNSGVAAGSCLTGERLAPQAVARTARSTSIDAFRRATPVDYAWQAAELGRDPRDADDLAAALADEDPLVRGR